MDDELVVDVGFGVFIGRVARVPGLDDVPRGFGDGEVEAVYAGERGGEVSRVVLDCVGWAWVGLGEGKKTLLTLSCRWPGTGWRSRAGWHLRCSTLWCWPMAMRCLPKGDAAGQFRPHHALPESGGPELSFPNIGWHELSCKARLAPWFLVTCAPECLVMRKGFSAQDTHLCEPVQRKWGESRHIQNSTRTDDHILRPSLISSPPRPRGQETTWKRRHGSPHCRSFLLYR